MGNIKLKENEIILLESTCTSKLCDGILKLTLTSKRILIEGEKGWFKKKYRIIKRIKLEKVEVLNEKVQIKRKGNIVEIFAKKSVVFEFEKKKDAKSFVSKSIVAITGKTWLMRSVDKVKAYMTKERIEAFMNSAVIVSSAVSTISSEVGNIQKNINVIKSLSENK